MSPGMNTFTLKSDELQAREALRAFWAGSSLGRPALCVKVRRRDYVAPPDPCPALAPRQRQFEPACHVHQARQALEGYHFLAEAMPVARTDYAASLALLTDLLGAEYEVREGTAWIHPVPDILERPVPAFDPSHPTIAGLERCMRAMAAHVGRQGFVNPPALGLDAQTALSLLRGGEPFYLDLTDRPRAVADWCRQVTQLLIAVSEHFFRVALELGYGEGAAWYECMAEGRFQGVQCDVAPAISPRLFEEMVLPDLRAFTEHLDRSVYHLDGTAQLRFLDQLACLPRLNGIQWNPEPSARPPGPWLDTFKEIRRRGWCLVFNRWDIGTVANAVLIAKAVGPDGLFIDLPVFDTLDEAYAAIEAIRRVC
jgi:hypothetical protein